MVDNKTERNKLVSDFIRMNKNFYVSVRKGMTFHYDDTDDIKATINEALLNVADKWLKTNKKTPFRVYAYPRVRRALKLLCHYNGLMGLTTSLAEHMTATNKLERTDSNTDYGTKINCCKKYRSFKRLDINTSFLSFSKYHSMFTEASPIDKIMNQESIYSIIKAKIPNEPFKILYEHAVNNKSFSKIAKEVNKSNVSVWKTYNKTIKLLQKEINKEDVGEWLS